ncbi:MAG: RDD family protein [Bacillus sp. (in: Bacteria)]|nr:RDD family protein [Bacillus sp. (in: firmicutes)]
MEKERITVENSDGMVQEKGELAFPAGFWLRFWAYLMDLIVVASISGIILLPILTWTTIGDWTIWIYSVGAILSSIVSFSYFVLLTKQWGQTLGKRIMGIEVKSSKGQLTWQDVLMREVVGRYIHQSIVITNIIYLMVPIHPQKKGLHDIIGDTYVIVEPREKKIMH